jgi:uncharacterized protein YkwD
MAVLLKDDESMGISYCTAAENIARNYSVKAAFDAFMNSRSPRKYSKQRS